MSIVRLALILTGIVLVITCSTLLILYNAALKEQLENLRVMVQSQARLVEEDYAFDRAHFAQYAKTDAEVLTYTQQRLRRVHQQYEGFGKSGEYTLAKKEAERIRFLLTHRFDEVTSEEKSIPFEPGIAEPMQQALSGKSGMMIGKDYRGVTVLAAYEPVNLPGSVGMVAKMDLAELLTPYIRLGFYILAGSLLLIILGVWMIIRVTNPLLNRMQRSENYYRTLLDTVPDIITELDSARMILWMNEAGRRFYGEASEGKKVTSFLVGEQPAFEMIDAIFKGKERSLTLESQQRRFDGQVRTLSWRFGAVEDREGKIASVLSTARDITETTNAYRELEELNRMLRLFSRCNEVLVQAKDEAELLDKVVHILHEQGNYGSVFVARHETDKSNVLACAGIYGKEDLLHYFSLPEEQQTIFPVKEVQETFLPRIVEDVDISRFVSLEPDSEAVRRSLGVFPLMIGRGEGMLILCTEDQHKFSAMEIQMVGELIDDMEYGLASIMTMKEKEQAKERLEEYTRRYKLASEVARTAAWEIWPETGKLYSDDGFRRLIGYEPEEIGENLSEWIGLLHPDDQGKAQMVLKKMAAGDRDKQTIEVRFRQKNGRYHWFLISGSRVDLDENIWRIYGAVTDINDLIRAYEELARKNEQFYNTIEHAPIPIMLHAEDGEVLRINRVWSDLTGYTHEMIPTIDAWISSACREKYDKPDSSEELGAKMEGEYAVTTAEGEKLLWYFTSASIGKLADGRDVVINTALDVTELHEKEEQMIAQSRQAAMGDMIAMIAHQWRQPITVIAMASNNVRLDLELDGEVTTQKIHQMLDTVTEQTQHLSKTIDDFRNFFKPNKEAEAVKIGSVVESAMKIIGKSLENNNINVEVTDKSIQSISTYPNELLQVLLNIMGNAKDAHKIKERDDAFIRITTWDEASGVSLEICDNAGGIPEEMLNKIGQPYFTTKEENGTGLGLYMSKIIVHKHLEGLISWENRDKGACFRVELPRFIRKDAE